MEGIKFEQVQLSIEADLAPFREEISKIEKQIAQFISNINVAIASTLISVQNMVAITCRQLTEGAYQFVQGALTYFELLNESILGLDGSTASVGDNMGSLQEFISSMSDLATIASFLKEIGEGMDFISGQSFPIGFTAGVSGLSGGLSELTAILTGTIAPILGVCAIIGILIAAIVYLWQTSDSFKGTVMGIVDGISGVLLRLWNEILVPLGTFLLDIYNTILKPIAVFLWDVLCTVIDYIFQLLGSIFYNILMPIANFLIDILAFALQTVKEKWEEWKPTIEMIITMLKLIWEEYLKPIVDFIVVKLCGALVKFKEAAQKAMEDVTGFFKGIILFFIGIFTSDWEMTWNGIKLMLTSFISFLSNVFGVDFNSVFAFMTGIIEGFTGSFDQIFAGIKTMLSGFVNFIKGVFKGDWQAAWDGIKQIFEGLWASIKGVINSILGGIQGMANGVIKGINTVIKALNNVSFEIPDWVLGLGGKTFGFDLKQLSEITIPKLADGGILSSGQLFIAREAGPELVGKHGTKTGVLNNQQIVDSVSSGVAQAVASVMAGLGNNKDNAGPIEVNLVVDGRTLAKVITDTNKRNGYSFSTA